MLDPKRCLGCNAPMPTRGASRKGWEIITDRGHTYRQCGCLPRRQFLWWVEQLVEAGSDYPTRRLYRAHRRALRREGAR